MAAGGVGQPDNLAVDGGVTGEDDVVEIDIGVGRDVVVDGKVAAGIVAFGKKAGVAADDVGRVTGCDHDGQLGVEVIPRQNERLDGDVGALRGEQIEKPLHDRQIGFAAVT